ncbi:UPF0481 protein At3g47200 [Cucumis sativus]|uniref:Uncharacterized protein n=1 Tax=Cucumis sativus TaxID=3659 RepID=A0A0A0LSF4_CUCSA|nr:UPF0481 protein At3g47200 [Cucumis sativus]
MAKSSEIGVHKGKAKRVHNNNIPHISEAKQHLRDNVVISIQQILNQMHPASMDCSIYRVPQQLCDMNPKAYIPQFISIGPFHHSKCQNNSKGTQKYKHYGLFNFLRRINNTEIKEEEDVMTKSRSFQPKTLKVLVEKVHDWVEKTRYCFSEPIDYMDDHNFVIMMLMDACFIVEFFIQMYDDQFDQDDQFPLISDKVNILSLFPEITDFIMFDLIKLENQVPFFLLQHVFDMIPRHNLHVSFIDLTYCALRIGFIFNYKIYSFDYDFVKKDLKHLVHFLSLYFIPPPTTNDMIQNKKKNNYSFLSFFSRLLCCELCQNPDKENSDQEFLSPPSITELNESGVTVKKAKNVESLMNITFTNGVLEIPPLNICDEFELLFRNLVAFEQFQAGNGKMYATQYIIFMDNLINTKKDVRLLVNSGVIINNIGGSYKEVSKLFNKLGKFISGSPTSSEFNDISKDLHKHCNRRWNKAKASLKHNYFNTPWAIVSFIAASCLILLTLLQTIFSGFSAFP